MKKYDVDDQGNIAYFYAEIAPDDWELIAVLNREAGPENDVDSVYTWDGGKIITKWAIENGYNKDIAFAIKTRR